MVVHEKCFLRQIRIVHISTIQTILASTEYLATCSTYYPFPSRPGYRATATFRIPFIAEVWSCINLAPVQLGCTHLFFAWLTSRRSIYRLAFNQFLCTSNWVTRATCTRIFSCNLLTCPKLIQTSVQHQPLNAFFACKPIGICIQ